jgi:hypothetical protein
VATFPNQPDGGSRIVRHFLAIDAREEGLDPEPTGLAICVARQRDLTLFQRTA